MPKRFVPNPSIVRVSYELVYFVWKHHWARIPVMFAYSLLYGYLRVFKKSSVMRMYDFSDLLDEARKGAH